MYEKIKETAAWLRERMPNAPTTAIVLGSGLGELAKRIERLKTFPYSEIPNFPVSTVEGHAGELIFGKLAGRDVMAMEGRFHYYEGWTMQQVTFPVRVMYELGIKTLFVSNAAGGTNPNFSIGDLMFITDHINFMPENPLQADKIAKKHGIKVQHGVYLATQGPTYETPAEYRMFARWGADAVGMSTVPEVIVAHHCGIEVFGMSIITDLGGMENPMKITHEEVLRAAEAAQPLMSTIIVEMVKSE